MSARLVTVESVSAEDEDADVAQERRRVHEGWAQDDLLRMCELTKVRSSSPGVSPSGGIAASNTAGRVSSSGVKP